jgi:hypothetical protein
MEFIDSVADFPLTPNLNGWEAVIIENDPNFASRVLASALCFNNP